MQEKEHTGYISFKEMQKIFHETSWLTPKEINLILRRYVMDQGHDKIKYTEFAEQLYDARFCLFTSRVMDTNIDHIESEIVRECEHLDVKNTGEVPIKTLKDVILNNKKIVLTPF